MHTKQFYWQKGYDAFESGRRIAAFGCKNWQQNAFKAGYEYAKAASILHADTPEEYQIAKLKAVIKNS